MAERAATAMADEPLAELRLRADGGDLRATLDVGVRLLGGEGSAEEGASLIQSAFDAGEADAGTMMATIEAMGAGRPQNWANAFDWLEQAARSSLCSRAIAILRYWRAIRSPIPMSYGRECATRSTLPR